MSPAQWEPPDRWGLPGRARQERHFWKSWDNPWEQGAPGARAIHVKQQRSKSSFVSSWFVERIGRWFKGSGGFEILVLEKEGLLVCCSETKQNWKAKHNVKLQGSVRKATGTTHVAMYPHLRIYAEQLMKHERKMDKSGRQRRGPLSIIDDTLHI